MRLAHKVAVITGAASGIGRTAGLLFAAEGAAVAAIDVDDARGEALAREIAERGGRARYLHADVSSRSEVQAMVSAVHECFGPVDILINNAAISRRTPWLEISEQEWDRIMAVDLKGCFLCSRAVYADMHARGYGKIVNVSSVTVALAVHKNLLSYISAKAGVIGFTRALAREVGGDGIRVNCVMPGAIRTESELELFPDQEALARWLSERQCLKRRGVPEDVAAAYLFLASPESDFITGQVINVDGGWAMY